MSNIGYGLHGSNGQAAQGTPMQPHQSLNGYENMLHYRPNPTTAQQMYIPQQQSYPMPQTPSPYYHQGQPMSQIQNSYHQSYTMPQMQNSFSPDVQMHQQISGMHNQLLGVQVHPQHSNFLMLANGNVVDMNDPAVRRRVHLANIARAGQRQAAMVAQQAQLQASRSAMLQNQSSRSRPHASSRSPQIREGPGYRIRKTPYVQRNRVPRKQESPVHEEPEDGPKRVDEAIDLTGDSDDNIPTAVESQDNGNLFLDPLSSLLADPLPALPLDPSSSLSTEPSPVLPLDPSGSLSTEPSPALSLGPWGSLSTELSPTLPLLDRSSSTVEQTPENTTPSVQEDPFELFINIPESDGDTLQVDNWQDKDTHTIPSPVAQDTEDNRQLFDVVDTSVEEVNEFENYDWDDAFRSQRESGDGSDNEIQGEQGFSL